MTLTIASAVNPATGGAGTDDGLGVHGLHLLLLMGAWLVALAVWQLAERARRRRRERGGQPGTLLPGLESASLALVAAATAGGGLVHLAVSPEHFEESTTYGVFFLALGVLQIVWSAALLRRPSAALLRLGGAVSAGVVLLWFDTRFVGLGLGPLEPGREALGALDLVATGAELLLVVYAVRHARVLAVGDGPRRQRVRG